MLLMVKEIEMIEAYRQLSTDQKIFYYGRIVRDAAIIRIENKESNRNNLQHNSCKANFKLRKNNG